MPIGTINLVHPEPIEEAVTSIGKVSVPVAKSNSYLTDTPNCNTLLKICGDMYNDSKLVGIPMFANVELISLFVHTLQQHGVPPGVVHGTMALI